MAVQDFKTPLEFEILSILVITDTSGTCAHNLCISVLSNCLKLNRLTDIYTKQVKSSQFYFNSHKIILGIPIDRVPMSK